MKDDPCIQIRRFSSRPPLPASAGLAHAEDVTLTIESWRNDDLADLEGQADPGLRGQEPGHQGGLRADRRRPSTMPP